MLQVNFHYLSSPYLVGLGSYNYEKRNLPVFFLLELFFCLNLMFSMTLQILSNKVGHVK
tara:strand:+ start:8327 stop:8503 length:177 start_codon:yes stop_codon:yes gene_type:complete